MIHQWQKDNALYDKKMSQKGLRNIFKVLTWPPTSPDFSLYLIHGVHGSTGPLTYTISARWLISVYKNIKEFDLIKLLFDITHYYFLNLSELQFC